MKKKYNVLVTGQVDVCIYVDVDANSEDEALELAVREASNISASDWEIHLKDVVNISALDAVPEDE